MTTAEQKELNILRQLVKSQQDSIDLQKKIFEEFQKEVVKVIQQVDPSFSFKSIKLFK